MRELRFHPAARTELIEAIVAHEAARHGYGERLAAEVEETVAQIVEYPDSGALLPSYPPSSTYAPFESALSAIR